MKVQINAHACVFMVCKEGGICKEKVGQWNALLPDSGGLALKGNRQSYLRM